MRKEFPKTAIIMNIETCKECTMCESHRTKNAGFALDYHCIHPDILKQSGCGDDSSRPGKKVMGYVEYSADDKPVPDWCPMRHDNCVEKITWLENQLLQRIETSQFAIDQLQEKEILCQTVKNFEDYLNELRNKYGKLHTYWQLQNLDTEYKLAKYNFDDLKLANEAFISLLEIETSIKDYMYCDKCKNCFDEG